MLSNRSHAGEFMATQKVNLFLRSAPTDEPSARMTCPALTFTWVPQPSGCSPVVFPETVARLQGACGGGFSVETKPLVRSLSDWRGSLYARMGESFEGSATCATRRTSHAVFEVTCSNRTCEDVFLFFNGSRTVEITRVSNDTASELDEACAFGGSTILLAAILAFTVGAASAALAGVWLWRRKMRARRNALDVLTGGSAEVAYRENPLADFALSTRSPTFSRKSDF